MQCVGAIAIVLGLHNLPISWTWKKLNLLLASYLFYAAWNSTAKSMSRFGRCVLG